MTAPDSRPRGAGSLPPVITGYVIPAGPSSPGPQPAHAGHGLPCPARSRAGGFHDDYRDLPLFRASVKASGACGLDRDIPPAVTTPLVMGRDEIIGRCSAALAEALEHESAARAEITSGPGSGQDGHPAGRRQGGTR